MNHEGHVRLLGSHFVLISKMARSTFSRSRYPKPGRSRSWGSRLLWWRQLPPAAVKLSHIASCLDLGFIITSFINKRVVGFYAMKEGLGRVTDWPIVATKYSLRARNGSCTVKCE
jgi:hypothetical protein